MEEEDRYTRITLRLPKDLHAALDVAAGATSKSLNAEIVGRLLKSIEPPSIDETEQLQRDLLDALRRDADLEFQTTRLDREHDKIIKETKLVMARLERAREIGSAQRRDDLGDELDVLRIGERACVARRLLLEKMHRKVIARIADLTRMLEESGALYEGAPEAQSPPAP